MRHDATFPAMGSSAHVLVVGRDAATAADLVHTATRRIEELEARWSRFRATSEVQRLNAHAGVPVVVSPDTVRLIEAMRLGYSVTDGAYDPTVLKDLVALGYDRDFADVSPSPDPLSPPTPLNPSNAPDPSDSGGRHARSGAFERITVSARSGLVWLPAGVGIDPGGIGKGLAADIVAEELVADGALGALVNIGGDIRVVGTPDDGAFWRVDIRDPFTEQPVTQVALIDGGVATSSALRRRWRHDGLDAHHLIDPATGTSTNRDVVGASVIASEAWRAEVLTKAVFVAGCDRGLAIADRFGAAVRVVARYGAVRANDGWRRHVGLHQGMSAR